MSTLTKEIITEKYSDTKPEHVEWLWENKIPNMGVTLFVGDPEAGKTTTSIYIAAQVSTGRTFPNCKKPTDAGTVLIISGEDSHPAIVLPRLMVAGADLTKVERIIAVRTTVTVGEETKSQNDPLTDLGENLDALENKIKAMPNFKLLILDTLTSYLGKKDISSMGDMKGLLDRLSEMAYQHHFAVIAIHHFNKNEDASAAYRSLGSTGIRAAARSEWGFVRDEHDQERFLMLCGKSSWGKKDTGLAFGIEGEEITIEGKPSWPGCCIFEAGVLQETLKDILEKKHKKGSPRHDEAVEWIRDFMKDGCEWCPDDVIATAGQFGIKEKTLRGALKEAGVTPRAIISPTTKRVESWRWKCAKLS